MGTPIASDHAGFNLKRQILAASNALLEFEDFGTTSIDSVDYPAFAHTVAQYVLEHPTTKGILICGTGNGMQMTANKHSDIRAALCWTPEIAQLAREHNDANILVLPARFIDTETAIQCVTTFFNTAFAGGRHQNRVDQINV
ncbi:ribose 5-phosphate isomerase B [Bacteroidia bacterium]|nr:ribose 5-phosphate isomerase B [Bacteroidia bacterium]